LAADVVEVNLSATDYDADPFALHLSVRMTIMRVLEVVSLVE
jgi:hypothetical protein